MSMGDVLRYLERHWGEVPQGVLVEVASLASTVKTFSQIDGCLKRKCKAIDVGTKKTLKAKAE